jgi:hypothetical protein
MRSATRRTRTVSTGCSPRMPRSTTELEAAGGAILDLGEADWVEIGAAGEAAPVREELLRSAHARVTA